MAILRSVSTLAPCLSRNQSQRTTKKHLYVIDYPYPKTNRGQFNAHSPKDISRKNHRQEKLGKFL